MLDEDITCLSCLREAIERRFFFYPNHMSARVTQLPSDNKENCTICGATGAKYSVSIIMGSINKEKLIREREMIKEANRNSNLSKNQKKQ